MPVSGRGDGMRPRLLLVEDDASVRRSLSDPYSLPMSVTQAALNAGFTDLGRFSAYYRRLYGESPSLTRKRAAELN